MGFRVDVQLRYQVYQRSSALFCVHALATERQRLRDEKFEVGQDVFWEELASGGGSPRFVRVDTQGVGQLDVRYSVVAEPTFSRVPFDEIGNSVVGNLPPEVIPYLFPSRYCESDRLWRLAWKQFGGIDSPYDQVVSICDWIFDSVDYLGGATDTATSAFDTVTQRAGVCRDFAHLGIAFCRALSIPARYFAGYACEMQPPDFHACFEAYVGGRWIIFDPTRLAPLNGLVRIANGRDAADASVATIFGSMGLEWMSVSCVAEGGFAPLQAGDLVGHVLVVES